MVSEPIKAQIATDFPESEWALIEWALDCYGLESYEREIERVQEAIVWLTKGNVEKLLHYVEVAKQDYRDILYWFQIENAKSSNRNQ